MNGNSVTLDYHQMAMAAASRGEFINGFLMGMFCSVGLIVLAFMIWMLFFRNPNHQHI